MHNQRRRERCLIAVVVFAAAWSLIGDASAQVPVPTAPPTASSPGCHTEDASGQPATLFGPGDRLVVKGDGFGGVAAIRVTFVQGSRTLNVTTSFTDELGVFMADKPEAKIPDTAAPGRGEIHAFSTSRVAVCAVQIMAAAGGGSATPRPRETGSRLWFYVWASALAVFGLFLLAVIVRRWRAGRLARAVAGRADAEVREVPRLAETPVVGPIIPGTPELGPIFPDEPPLLEADVVLDRPQANAEPKVIVEDEPVRAQDRSVVDEPARDDAPLPDLFSEKDEAEALPRAPTVPDRGTRSAPPGDDFEEFVFRDGKWRLRDELDGRPYTAPRPSVDVAEAREVADALRVPALRKDASEPPLLDPVEAELPEWWSEPGPRQRTARVEGTVSDTVQRLVENTKDWTKR